MLVRSHRFERMNEGMRPQDETMDGSERQVKRSP